MIPTEGRDWPGLGLHIEPDGLIDAMRVCVIEVLFVDIRCRWRGFLMTEQNISQVMCARKTANVSWKVFARIRFLLLVARFRRIGYVWDAVISGACAHKLQLDPDAHERYVCVCVCVFY